jgi:hypothetical protein
MDHSHPARTGEAAAQHIKRYGTTANERILQTTRAASSSTRPTERCGAHCVDEQADAAKGRITDALGAAEPEPGPGEEETATASRQPEKAVQPPSTRQDGRHIAPSGGRHTAPILAVRARP